MLLDTKWDVKPPTSFYFCDGFVFSAGSPMSCERLQMKPYLKHKHKHTHHTHTYTTHTTMETHTNPLTHPKFLSSSHTPHQYNAFIVYISNAIQPLEFSVLSSHVQSAVVSGISTHYYREEKNQMEESTTVSTGLTTPSQD